MQAGCALVGGETAEHPGVMGADEYDISGTGVGVVNADAVLGPDRVAAGRRADRAGLVRAALERLLAGAPRAARAGRAGARRDRPTVLGGRTLGDELLTPDPDLRPGLPGAGRRVRRARVRPHHRRRAGRQPGPGAARPGCGASSTAATWAPQPIFDLIRTHRRRRRAPSWN